MITVFQYTDYRRFLRDKFSELKRKNPRFSYRAFNRLAGLRSSATLKLVTDGKRNLAFRGIQKIARGFKLNEQEERFFRALVLFNQAHDPEEKDLRLRELHRLSTLEGVEIGNPMLASTAHRPSEWEVIWRT